MSKWAKQNLFQKKHRHFSWNVLILGNISLEPLSMRTSLCAYYLTNLGYMFILLYLVLIMMPTSNLTREELTLMPMSALIRSFTCRQTIVNWYESNIQMPLVVLWGGRLTVRTPQLWWLCSIPWPLSHHSGGTVLICFCQRGSRFFQLMRG